MAHTDWVEGYGFTRGSALCRSLNKPIGTTDVLAATGDHQRKNQDYPDLSDCIRETLIPSCVSSGWQGTTLATPSLCHSRGFLSQDTSVTHIGPRHKKQPIKREGDDYRSAQRQRRLFRRLALDGPVTRARNDVPSI